MPEKNDKKIKELENESIELKTELDKANQLLQTKMEEVNKETNVRIQQKIFLNYNIIILIIIIF